ncbi:hypothetical protein QTG54_015263 [Skeletonema marinoi]|uniref:Uncharacterized protein n=1 Tax=Skeletonema marinoi TaxID=267567 RepID=A0AAD8XV64_9STRA|nr:hypothetical protein QTG54_015263 [Skeletonema marinoi]
MTFSCLNIMRPTPRCYPTAYFLALIVLIAYCVWQQHDLDHHLRGKSQRQTAGNINIDQAIAVDNHLPPPPSVTHTIKVSYVTSFWAKVIGEEEINPHRREVEAALLANIHNPHFDQVVVHLATENNAESCLDFRQAMSDLSRQVLSMTADESNELLTNKLKCLDVQAGQPSYYQMFSDALSDEVIGDVVVLANADIAFDDSMSLARFLNPEVLAVLSTHGFSNRMAANIKNIYEEMMGTDYITDVEQRRGHPGSWEIDRCAESRFSWDTWIFHKSKLMGTLKEENFKRLSKTNELIPFYMNESGAENAALWAIEQSYPFSSTYNVCDRIQSWHFHLTSARDKQARQTPWLRVGDENSPLFSSPGFVPPRPYGFPQKASVGEPPSCVRIESCFLSEYYMLHRTPVLSGAELRSSIDHSQSLLK